MSYMSWMWSEYSNGTPPASSTPRFTCSASVRKCALQGVSSEKVLQMPITGRPSKASSGRPEFFIQERWMNASLLSPPNQACERSGFPAMVSSSPMAVCAARGSMQGEDGGASPRP